MIDPEPVPRSLLSPGSAYRPASGWGPWLSLVAAGLIVGGAILVASFVGILLFQATPGNTIDRPALLTLGLWQVLLISLTVAVSAWAGSPRAVLALDRPVGLRIYVEALAIVLAFQVLSTGLELLFVPELMLRDLRPYADLARGPLFPLGLLMIGVGAPLSEELLFRGFLFSGLAGSRLGVRGAGIVTTVFWTALHAGYAVTGLLEIFLVGLMFSWLLWKTGSLRVTLICHAVYNTLILIALRFVTLPPAPVPA